jgi:hypothetical protein
MNTNNGGMMVNIFIINSGIVYIDHLIKYYGNNFIFIFTILNKKTKTWGIRVPRASSGI